MTNSSCSLLTEIGPAYVLDGAIHGTDITIDERDTAAAAPTASSFRESGALTAKPYRPFLYLIRHR